MSTVKKESIEGTVRVWKRDSEENLVLVLQRCRRSIAPMYVVKLLAPRFKDRSPCVVHVSALQPKEGLSDGLKLILEFLATENDRLNKENRHLTEALTLATY